MAVSGAQLFVGGWVNEAVQFGTTSVTSTSDDMVLLGMSSGDGTVNWVRSWSGSGNDHIYGITAIGSQVISTGRIAETVDLDGVSAPGGCQDAFLARFAGDSGAPAGAFSFGGSDCNDLGRTVARYDDSSVLVVGELVGVSSVLGVSVTPIGQEDAFVALVPWPQP